MNVQRQTETCVYFDADTSDRSTDRYTVFCAAPGTPRGQYDEEIDVDASGEGHARAVADGAIGMDYDNRLSVKRVVKRIPGFLY